MGIRQQNGGRQTEKLIWKAIRFELLTNNANAGERSLLGTAMTTNGFTPCSRAAAPQKMALTPPTGAPARPRNRRRPVPGCWRRAR